MFAFKDGELIYRTSKTFTIPDTLFAKVKNSFKKMHALYCQYVHRMDVENKVKLPDVVIPEDDEDVTDKFEYEPNEDDLEESDLDEEIEDDDLNDDAIDDEPDDSEDVDY